MSHEPDSLPPPERDRDPDPEIDALLDFDPVYRRIQRSDGWPAPVQRGFIAALARTGSVEHAAFAVHRSAGGAWKLRGDGSGQSFAGAWDGAVALWHERNPKQPRRGGRARGAWAEAAAPEPEAERDDDALWEALVDSLFGKYLQKLDQERVARLEGRIVEADYYVRQLTWIEVAMDLGGAGEKAIEKLKSLKRGESHAGEIVATPVSLLLDRLRRAYWEEEGGPDRPPLPPLGPNPGEDHSIGEPLESARCPERDGPGPNQDEQHREHLRRNAEAQRAWEEKAKADAAAWRARVAGEEIGRGGAKDGEKRS